MKLTTSILLAAAHLTGVLSAAVPDDAAECGTLGLMTYAANDLPAGLTLADIRKCADHPLGHDRVLSSLAPMPDSEADPAAILNTTPADSSLGVRKADKCYYGAPYGCSDGYCWKTCGNDGEWCWTASNLGLGAWYTCSTWQDCGTTTYACGVGCASCGCGC